MFPTPGNVLTSLMMPDMFFAVITPRIRARGVRAPQMNLVPEPAMRRARPAVPPAVKGGIVVLAAGALVSGLAAFWPVSGPLSGQAAPHGSRLPAGSAARRRGAKRRPPL